MKAHDDIRKIIIIAQIMINTNSLGNEKKNQLLTLMGKLINTYKKTPLTSVRNPSVIQSRKEMVTASTSLKDILSVIWVALGSPASELSKDKFAMFLKLIYTALLGSKENVITSNIDVELGFISSLYDPLVMDNFFDFVVDLLELWSDLLLPQCYNSFCWCLIDSIVDVSGHPPRLRTLEDIMPFLFIDDILYIAQLLLAEDPVDHVVTIHPEALSRVSVVQSNVSQLNYSARFFKKLPTDGKYPIRDDDIEEIESMISLEHQSIATSELTLGHFEMEYHPIEFPAETNKFSNFVQNHINYKDYSRLHTTESRNSRRQSRNANENENSTKRTIKSLTLESMIKIRSGRKSIVEKLPQITPVRPQLDLLSGAMKPILFSPISKGSSGDSDVNQKLRSSKKKPIILLPSSSSSSSNVNSSSLLSTSASIVLDPESTMTDSSIVSMENFLFDDYDHGCNVKGGSPSLRKSIAMSDNPRKAKAIKATEFNLPREANRFNPAVDDKGHVKDEDKIHPCSDKLEGMPSNIINSGENGAIRVVHIEKAGVINNKMMSDKSSVLSAMNYDRLSPLSHDGYMQAPYAGVTPQNLESSRIPFPSAVFLPSPFKQRQTSPSSSKSKSHVNSVKNTLRNLQSNQRDSQDSESITNMSSSVPLDSSSSLLDIFPVATSTCSSPSEFIIACSDDITRPNTVNGDDAAYLQNVGGESPSSLYSTFTDTTPMEVTDASISLVAPRSSSGEILTRSGIDDDIAEFATPIATRSRISIDNPTSPSNAVISNSSPPNKSREPGSPLIVNSIKFSGDDFGIPRPVPNDDENATVMSSLSNKSFRTDDSTGLCLKPLLPLVKSANVLNRLMCDSMEIIGQSTLLQSRNTTTSNVGSGLNDSHPQELTKASKWKGNRWYVDRIPAKPKRPRRPVSPVSAEIKNLKLNGVLQDNNVNELHHSTSLFSEYGLTASRSTASLPQNNSMYASNMQNSFMSSSSSFAYSSTPQLLISRLRLHHESLHTPPAPPVPLAPLAPKQDDIDMENNCATIIDDELSVYSSDSFTRKERAWKPSFHVEMGSHGAPGSSGPYPMYSQSFYSLDQSNPSKSLYSLAQVSPQYGPWIPQGVLDCMYHDKSNAYLGWEERKKMSKFVQHDPSEVRMTIKKQDAVREVFESFVKDRNQLEQALQKSYNIPK